MEFYYAEEKRKFDKSWEETAKYYAEQGMEQSAIDANIPLDALKWFGAFHNGVATRCRK